MQQFARFAKSKSVEVIPIVQPFSNFNFVDNQCKGFESLRRIMSQVRQHGGRTMIREELEIGEAEDLLGENADLKKRFGCAFASKACRLSFFRKAFTTVRGLASLDDKDFIGYAIVKYDNLPKGFKKARVYESIIRKSHHKNNYIRGEQAWTCLIADRSITIDGYLYAQQNEATNICAHVALRTAAARFHKNGDMTYGEMNRLPGIRIDHLARKTGSPDGEGLNQDQMVEVLEAAGARCIKVEYQGTEPEKSPLPPFQKYLYGSIESGFPAIVCFGTAGNSYHAIPVFGHTFNEDTWVPSAGHDHFQMGAGTKYISSESWLSTFIGHDDNWGSNFCIPRDYLYTKKYCENMIGGPGLCKKQEERVFCVIATLPKEVTISPLKAEALGAMYLFEMLKQLPSVSSQWQNRLDGYAKSKRLVLRPILVDGPEYANHLGKLSDWERRPVATKIVKVLAESLPKEKLWLVELSVPELFSANRRKIAEVLIRTDTQTDERNYFLIARLPGCFAVKDPSNSNFMFVRSGAESHVPLFGCE